MKVYVKESTLVYPAQDAPNGSLWLSDIDHIHAQFHMSTLYFFKVAQNDDNLNATQVTLLLKESLSKVLVAFYPFAGRLGRDEKGRLEIECNAKGVLFSQAETDTTLDELEDQEFTPNAELRQLVPTVDCSSDMSSIPLAIMQVTFFKCGGICLGVGLFHVVVDGLSGMYFINSWANMARGHPIDPPLLDRTILSHRVLPSPKYPHPEFNLASVISCNQQIPESCRTTSVAHLKVSLDHLKNLKDKTKGNNGRNYSTYEIIAAHIWRCACKARGLGHLQSTRVYTAVDRRTRLCPPVPKSFFGNVVLPICTVALSGDLLKEPLPCTADRIHEVIERADDEYMRSALSFLHQNLKAMEGFTRQPFSSNTNVRIISWTQMPTHGMDFGWGQPFYVAPAFTFCEGKGYIMSSPKKDGSLSLFLCLADDHMEAFKKLFYEF